MIEIRNLSKSYSSKVEVLTDVSITINEGEIYGIIGHSGAGKSTLLRCINGLEGYNSGSLVVMGQEVKSLKGKKLRTFRKDLGMIFQGFNLLKRKTVFDNVALPLQVWGWTTPKVRNRVNELLQLVGLEDKAKVKPSSLSGGQQQRVAIARALALNPKILLCDEATSALDPKTTKDILQLLLKINKELGITIVVVTHQMEVVKDICEKVALIEGGVIRAEGKSKDLFLNPGVSLKKFLGEEDESEVLPSEGTNIKIFFSDGMSKDTLITSMARELSIDFSIVWGKLEKFRESVLGSLVINVTEENKQLVIDYLEKNQIVWEVL
ncbi:methionine ABC transporter ATP-binding protein [Inconstantimicrobium mannanitabidum]|uniref:Methionine import ATP-binding protein MetN n=1 Tax=Inconstantimicrobium mannanitabidum TaxID=1604901 RepID=A0ACB5R860_9CLOT|nr:methionine ABC transporter ATP-binding protein [Clostridium sp. TW13]GKX65146.1 methionine import ATP-binding protein MetN [Clostridium sp. TW13]